jgi:hypothetical protein
MGIQRALSSESAKAGFALLYGAPNEKAAPVFKRVGYRHLGDAIRYAKPLTAGFVLDKLGVPDTVAKLGSLATNRLLGSFHRWRAGDGQRYECDLVDEPDAGFDALWNDRNAAYVTGEKSCAYLRWRFGRGDHQFFRMRQDGRMVGMAVVSRVGNKAHIVELCGHEPGLDVLFTHLTYSLRGSGYDVAQLSVVTGSEVIAQLEQAGFVARAEKRPLYVFVADQAAVQAALLDGQRWMMLDGDLDV